MEHKILNAQRDLKSLREEIFGTNTNSILELKDSLKMNSFSIFSYQQPYNCLNN